MDKNSIEASALKKLCSGRLPYASYAEIAFDIDFIFTTGNKIATVNTTVADFMKHHGFSVEEDGVGWIMGLTE